MSADGRVGLWPQDLHPRADAVMTFTVGHMAVQDELDARPDRDLAEWIALMSGDVGRAAMLIARDPEEPDALRAAVAWLACASADGLRACSAFTGRRSSADRAAQLKDLHAVLVSTLMSEPAWRPAIQIAFVVAALGRLAEAAEAIIRADPDAHGSAPRFERAVTAAIMAMSPELAAEAAASEDADAAVDPVEATVWALEDGWRSAAAAAVSLHPGGPVAMPTGVDDGP